MAKKKTELKKSKHSRRLNTEYRGLRKQNNKKEDQREKKED